MVQADAAVADALRVALMRAGQALEVGLDALVSGVTAGFARIRVDNIHALARRGTGAPDDVDRDHPGLRHVGRTAALLGARLLPHAGVAPTTFCFGME